MPNNEGSMHFCLLSSPYKAPFFPTPSQCTSELESPANVLCFFVHNSPLFWKQRWIFCYPTPWNSVSQSFLAPLMDLPPLNRVCVSSIPSLSLSIRAPRGFWDLHYLPHLQLKWIVFSPAVNLKNESYPINTTNFYGLGLSSLRGRIILSRVATIAKLAFLVLPFLLRLEATELFWMMRVSILTQQTVKRKRGSYFMFIC